MEPLILSAKECLFAAAKLGAKKFFGLADPFYGMTTDEIQQELGELQISLEKKGYAEVGFDNIFSLKTEVASLIRICADCQNYLFMHLLPLGEKEQQFLIYTSEYGIAVAEIQEQEITLQQIDEAAVVELILARIKPEALGKGEKISAIVRQASLADARGVTANEPENAIGMLERSGCPTEVATLLIRGFRGEAGRYSFFHTHVRERTLTAMIVLQSEAGAVCMKPEDINESLWSAEFFPDGITAETLCTLYPLKGDSDEVL